MDQANSSLGRGMGYSWGIHGVFMGYSWGIHGVFICIGYVSGMCRVCIGNVTEHTGSEGEDLSTMKTMITIVVYYQN